MTEKEILSSLVSLSRALWEGVKKQRRTEGKR